MEKIKKFFKSLLIRLSISGNIFLIYVLVDRIPNTKPIQDLCLCAILVVLFWKLGIFKLFWKIIKGICKCVWSFTSTSGSSLEETNHNIEDGEEIVMAYQDANDWLYIDTNKRSQVRFDSRSRDGRGYSYGCNYGKLWKYTASTLTMRDSNSYFYTFDIKGNLISERHNSIL